MIKVNNFKCAAWLTFTPPVVFFLTFFLPGMGENSTFWILFCLIFIEIAGISLWLKIILFYRCRTSVSPKLTDGESTTKFPQRKMTDRFKSIFGIVAAATGGILLITCLLLVWHIAQRQAQYCVWGPAPEISIRPTRYMIDECKSLKLNLDAIAKAKLDHARIEVRTGKVCFMLPCSSGQTRYDLGDNLTCNDKKTPFPGFNRGKSYRIQICSQNDGTLWQAEIHVADYWFKELYDTDINTIPAGTLTIGVIIVILCLTGIYQFGFGTPKKQRD